MSENQKQSRGTGRDVSFSKEKETWASSLAFSFFALSFLSSGHSELKWYITAGSGAKVGGVGKNRFMYLGTKQAPVLGCRDPPYGLKLLVHYYHSLWLAPDVQVFTSPMYPLWKFLSEIAKCFRQIVQIFMPVRPQADFGV